MTEGITHDLGREVRAERTRRGWTLSELALRAGTSESMVHGVEAGGASSVEGYMRLARALGLEPSFRLHTERLAGNAPDRDPVHAALGEIEAEHLQALGHEVLLDEPYQHFQYAGRADVLAIDRARRALLHIENRTRFPDIQAFAGSFNAKCAYLATDLASRLGIPGGFASESHVVVALWSAEVLHVVRLRDATFGAICPSPTQGFRAWWSGDTTGVPSRSRILVLFDPIEGVRRSRRRWVGLDAARTVEPRYRGYAEALAALRTRGRA